VRTPVYIAATGHYVPEERITNAQLEASLDTTDEWIMSHVGIKERRSARRDQRPSDLGVLATRHALEKAGWKVEDVDLLVCATTTPDALAPATSCFMGMKLGVNPVSLDVAAACSGFLYALQATHGLMLAGGYRRAICCATEDYTRMTDYTNRETCIFFGDSAGVALMQHEKPERGLELVDVHLVNVNEGAPNVDLPINGYFSQTGSKVRDYASECFYARSAEMLEKHGLAAGDLRAFVGHQANLVILNLTAERLGLTPEQHWHNVEWVGNQGAAGVATCFSQKLEEHADDLKDGDTFLLTTFGAGFTTGSALLRWIDTGS
jgi:3-oxoacyl-[acyl-carrier-protein] synthase-3